MTFQSARGTTIAQTLAAARAILCFATGAGNYLIFARLFTAEQSLIGPQKRIIERFIPFYFSNTNGRRHVDIRIGDAYTRTFYRFAYSLCKLASTNQLCVLKGYHKLVTTVTKHHIGFTSVFLQYSGKLPKHFITYCVSEIVVYQFETIYIANQ